MVIRQEENKPLLFEHRASVVLYKYLLSLAQKPGTFILPVNICPIVYSVFKAAGVNVLFIDIDENDLCLDRAKVIAALTEHRISGVLFNYSYGTTVGFSDFFNEIRQRVADDFIIIEDKCLGRPELDIPAGAVADLVLYSTGYSKYVDLKTGGYAFLNNVRTWRPEQYEAIKGEIILDDGETLDLGEPSLSFDNYRQQVELTKERARAHKSAINQVYYSRLNDSVTILPDQYNQWRFNILADNKEAILAQLFSQGLFASSHYKPLALPASLYPNAGKLHSRIINLFNDFNYSVERAEKTAAIINECSSF